MKDRDGKDFVAGAVYVHHHSMAGWDGVIVKSIDLAYGEQVFNCEILQKPHINSYAIGSVIRLDISNCSLSNTPGNINALVCVNDIFNVNFKAQPASAQ